MKQGNEEKNVYVQPDSKVYQVKLQRMIATSDTVQTESLQVETYIWS